MGTPAIETWFLIFVLARGQASTLDAGEYQTRVQCEAAAKMQAGHWRMIYGPHITHRCEQKRD